LLLRSWVKNNCLYFWLHLLVFFPLLFTLWEGHGMLAATWATKTLEQL
jgi:hypothetical protein